MHIAQFDQGLYCSSPFGQSMLLWVLANSEDTDRSVWMRLLTCTGGKLNKSVWSCDPCRSASASTHYDRHEKVTQILTDCNQITRACVHPDQGLDFLLRILWGISYLTVKIADPDQTEQMCMPIVFTSCRKLQDRFKPNLVGIFMWWSSTKIVTNDPIRFSKWLSWPLIG